MPKRRPKIKTTNERTGQRLKQLPEPVVAKTVRDIGGSRFYDGPTPAERHFDALKRILDRNEPDYAE